MPDDYGEFEDFEDDDYGEPVGSCDICDTNLYRDDDEHLCPHCEWAVMMYRKGTS